MGSLGFVALTYFGTNILAPSVNAETPLASNDSQPIDNQLG